MLWRCGKGHEWSTTLYLIKNIGRCTLRNGCNGCLNKHENLCHEAIITFLAYRPDFLKIHSQGLELDIYYLQYGFAIEVQGKQHESKRNYVKRKDCSHCTKKLVRTISFDMAVYLENACTAKECFTPSHYNETFSEEIKINPSFESYFVSGIEKCGRNVRKELNKWNNGQQFDLSSWITSTMKFVTVPNLSNAVPLA
ncbi:unnamed protein product [Rhizophagus irregularis]|nr:unnamed protein product [Rhizophagus irregularis]